MTEGGVCRGFSVKATLVSCGYRHARQLRSNPLISTVLDVQLLLFGVGFSYSFLTVFDSTLQVYFQSKSETASVDVKTK